MNTMLKNLSRSGVFAYSASVEEASNKWWDYAILVGKRGRVIPADLENLIAIPHSYIRDPSGF